MSRPNHGRRYHPAIAAVGLPAAGAAGLVAAWQAAVILLRLPDWLVATPAQVAEQLWQQPGYLAGHTMVTVTEVAVGFGIAAAGGIAVGTVLAFYQPVGVALYPPLVALHSIPKVALAPLLVVGLGFGAAPKITMVVLVSMFPVVLATTTGLQRTPAELVELMRSLAATRWQMFCKVRAPAAAAHIFHGLRQAAPLALIGAVLGELFGATEGLGWVVANAGSDTPLVYACLLLMGAISIGLFYTVAAAELVAVPWARHTTA